jgi:hypothetical protein
VSTQREEKIKYEAPGLKTSMTDEKLQHLANTDFQWSVQNNELWDQRFEELRKYKDENGHCRIPRQSSGKLGIWVKEQRSKRRSASRSKVRTARLDEIGFFD